MMSSFDYGAAQGSGTPQGYGPQQGYGAPSYGAPAGYGMPPVFQPTTWLLQLPAGARKLLTALIVIGALLMVGVFTFDFAVGIPSQSSTSTALAADLALTPDYTTLGNDLTNFGQATGKCNGNLTCATKLDTQLAGNFRTFSDQLAGIQVPSGAAADKAKLQADVTALAQDFAQLGKSANASQYNSTLSSTGLEGRLSNFQQDVTALDDKLTSY